MEKTLGEILGKFRERDAKIRRARLPGTREREKIRVASTIAELSQYFAFLKR